MHWPFLLLHLSNSFPPPLRAIFLKGTSVEPFEFLPRSEPPFAIPFSHVRLFSNGPIDILFSPPPRSRRLRPWSGVLFSVRGIPLKRCFFWADVHSRVFFWFAAACPPGLTALNSPFPDDFGPVKHLNFFPFSRFDCPYSPFL